MGLNEEEEEGEFDDSGYELDLTPTEDVDTPKSIVNKSSPGSDDRKEFIEEDLPDFEVYEDAIKFMKLNRLNYA